MNRSRLKSLTYSIVILLLWTSIQVCAQRPKRLTPASANEINQALQQVEADLNNFQAHRKYIIAMGITNPSLVTKYEEWMQKHPINVSIPLAIGTVFQNAAMPQAKEFLLKAAALDPRNPKVWMMLANDANMRGQTALVAEYVLKASLVDPTNPVYAYAYVKTFENSDPASYRQKVFDFAKRFPTSELGAQALYGFSLSATDVNDRLYCLEEL